MRHTAFFLFGMALLLVQANIFRLVGLVLSVASAIGEKLHLHQGPIVIPGLIPSLVLPLILFMGVHEYALARGAGVVFVLGYLTDLLGIAPVGLYTFTYVALYVLARSAGVRLAAQTKMMQVLLTLGFAIVHSIMVLVLIAIFGQDPWVPRALYPLAIPHALVTAACAPIVFALANRIHSQTGGGGAAQTDLGGMP